ncbi:hypothetical protein ACA30_15785 [Virgibacillus soli]|uniref:Uncharacterized protein n=1 Tax=Lederbergia galactosidilytica TaxID=217031 RepID=A0A0Q9Y3T0_9BACI|nr:hypothetical protein ACA29_17110 [Lederbergia galactosidilytica]KRG13357.1 hypothetical protein ACA30_15785 [Virgibacillus soli]
MQPTKEENAVQRALYRFWYEYYRKPLSQEKRNQLAEDFADKWLDPTKIKIDKTFIVHPETKKKIKQRTCTVQEVLADFILRVNHFDERKEEYPIKNQEISIQDRMERQKRELSILLQSEYDKAVAEAKEKGIAYRKPPYSVDEYRFNTESPVEYAVFSTESLDVKKYREELKNILEYPEYWAATLSKKYGYDEAETLKRIKALKLERVKECRVCGSGFYAHDMRRQVCDQQHGIDSEGKRSERSMCEIIDKHNFNIEYYENSVFKS